MSQSDTGYAVGLCRRLSQDWKVLLRHPGAWPRFAYALVFRPLRTRWRIRSKGLYSPSYYPADTRRLAERVITGAPVTTPLGLGWPLGKSLQRLSQAREVGEIRLAGFRIPVAQMQEYWYEPQGLGDQDLELGLALHRFHWLLELAERGPEAGAWTEACDLIDEWLDLHQGKQIGLPWQPYSVSERICNWAVFWTVMEARSDVRPANRQGWVAALTQHIQHLATELEYPASGIVNNHLINNARALYVGGQFLGFDEAVALGAHLLQKHFPSMMGEAYLLEGSSHYHWLLTRSMSEIWHVAGWSGDDRMHRWLQPIVERLAQGGSRLCPPDLQDIQDLPRIGDVSPDVPFYWFDPRPNGSELGWQAIWGAVRNPITDSRDQASEQDGWIIAATDDWFAVAFGHCGKLEYPLGHGHADFGSLCLYCGGRVILADPGRVTYADNRADDADGSAYQDHSTICIDGHAVLPEGRGGMGLLSGLVRNEAGFCVQNIRQGQGSGVEIEWSLPEVQGVIWRRRVTLSDQQGVLCSDWFEATDGQEHKLTAAFVLGPGLEVDADSDCWTVRGQGSAWKFTVQGADELSHQASSFFPEYGVRKTNARLCWKRRFENKVEIRTRIVVGDRS